jgi:predicted component of type VI protein secretion system
MIGKELTNSHRLQKLLKRKRLMNYFFKKASRKPALQEVLTDMLHNKESQTAFKSKWFWVKALLF